MIACRSLRRFAVAGAVSVAAHAALLGGGWLMPPQTPPAAPALSAMLQPARPAPQAAVAPPVRAPATRAPVTPAAATGLPAAADATAPHLADDSPDIAAATAVAGTAALPPAPPEAPAESQRPAGASAELPTEPQWPDFPRRGQISYQLSLGAGQTPVGRTVQTWTFDGTRYRLDSRSESSGMVEMIRPHRYIHHSEGRLTAAGLQPERFSASVRRGSRSEASIAAFDWEAQRVQLGRLPRQDSVELPPGSQDVVSLIYQLALVAPRPGRISLPFTRGTRMELASFDVLVPEVIDTPLGRLRAVPVIQVREHGAESLAVWLATDYRNLPVRIRFFNRDGELSGEQLAREIQIAER